MLSSNVGHRSLSRSPPCVSIYVLSSLCREHGLESLSQSVTGKWLLEKLDILNLEPFAVRLGRVVAGHAQHSHARPRSHGLLHEGHAVDPTWQDDVGQQNVDLGR